ncbi:hypothetical protein HY251_05480 [bacterium]|nr:hypothetical protein [bacterium]
MGLRSVGRGAGAALAASLVLAAAPAVAGEKKFTYVYEPQALAPGSVELEQWITPKLGKASGSYSQFDLRTEIEVGLLEDLQTSVYLNFRNTHAADVRVGERGSTNGDFITQDGKERFDQFEFEGFSNEWLYKLSDPVADVVGVALYFEWTTNGKELELEEKLILAKTWGGLTLAANLIAEQEWRQTPTDEAPREARFGATVGASYRIPKTPFSLGLEFRTEHVLELFGDYKHSVFSLGPVAHVAFERWWATLTLLPQIASQTPSYKWFDYDGFEVFEARLIVGVEF